MDGNGSWPLFICRIWYEHCSSATYWLDVDAVENKMYYLSPRIQTMYRFFYVLGCFTLTWYASRAMC